MLQGLEKNKQVLLVQPDILQLKKLAGQADANSIFNRDYGRYLDSVINIQNLWTVSKGQGIKIAIIDDGFYLQHQEFAKLSIALAYDVQSNAFMAMPNSNIDTHGTRVTGIIYSRHDKKGIDGIAPEAELIAIRQVDTWTSNTLLSFQIAMIAQADIINCSWNSNWLMEPIADAVDDMATYGRKGKGVAVIFAAGNDGREVTPQSVEAAIDKAIVVAAYDKHLIPLKESNFGASIDLWAYGARTRTTEVGGKYAFLSGSSLSAAVVSGLSALLMAKQPSIGIDELLQQLKRLTKRESIKFFRENKQSYDEKKR